MGSKGTWDFSRVRTFFKSEWGIRIAVLIGFAGIALILLSQLFMGSSGKSAASTPSEGITATAYRQELESQLAKVLSKLEGVGELHVMVTVDSAGETVYAVDAILNMKRQQSSRDDSSTETVQEESWENKHILIEGASGGEEPLVRSQNEPKVRGVLVVCEGAKSPLVQKRVLEAVSKLLGVSTAKICVTN